MKVTGGIRIFLAFVAFFSCFGAGRACDGFPKEDIVEILPGYDGELKSRWFSGYVNTTSPSKPGLTLSYHYILIESERDPENDPLVLWTNGGPGASSLWGLFTELGPLYVSEESLKTESYKKTGIPTLFEFDYGWSKFSNLLILSGPPPVSFGYCDKGGPSGDGFSCGAWNDELTAEANFHFLEGFFQKFPVYAKRNAEFYITGESYAGIYIPTLVDKILKHDDSTAKKLLKGVAIGDGCVGSDLVCSAITKNTILLEQMFSAQFLYGHGQVATPVYEHYVATCKPHFDKYAEYLKMEMENVRNKQSYFRRSADISREEVEMLKRGPDICTDMYKNIRAQVGFFFVYNLYDECWEVPNVPTSQAEQELEAELTETKFEPYPCGGSAGLDAYTKSVAVKEALHIPKDARFINADNGVGINYTASARNVLPLHYSMAVESKLRILIYNGDTDHELNSFFSEWWVNTLGLQKKEQWRPWTLDGKKEVVGYVERFEGHYDYVTIRGSGHMVPQMKPRAAFEMITQWLDNKSLKEYKP